MKGHQKTGSAVKVGGSKPVVMTPQVEKHVIIYKTTNPKISVKDMRQRLVQDGVCTSAPSVSSMGRLVRRLKANSAIPSDCKTTISSYYDNVGTSDALTSPPAVRGGLTVSPQLGSSESPMGSKQPANSDRQTPIHSWHTTKDGHLIPRGISQTANEDDGSKTAPSGRQTPMESQPIAVCQTPMGSWKSAIGLPEHYSHSWQNQAQLQQIPLYRQQAPMVTQHTPVAMDSWHTPVSSGDNWRGTSPIGNNRSTLHGQHIPTGSWHIPTSTWHIPQGSWQNENDSWYTPIGKQNSQSHDQHTFIDCQHKETDCMDSETSPSNARHTLPGGLQDSIGKFDNPVRRKLILSDKKYKARENKLDVLSDDTHNTVNHQKEISPLNIWQVKMGGKHPVVNIHHTPKDNHNAESQDKHSRDGDHQLTDISQSEHAHHNAPRETSKNGQHNVSTDRGFAINATWASIGSQKRASNDLQTTESNVRKRNVRETGVTNSSGTDSSGIENSDQTSIEKAHFSSKNNNPAYLEGQSSSVNTHHTAQLGYRNTEQFLTKSQGTTQKENAQPDNNKPKHGHYKHPMGSSLSDVPGMKKYTDIDKTMAYYGQGHSMRLPAKIASASIEFEPDIGRPMCWSQPSATSLWKATYSKQTVPDHGHSMGSPLSPLQRKRRVMFSSDQIGALEESFSKNQYPVNLVRDGLAQRLHLPIKSVQTWFANRRQRLKKVLGASLSSPTDYEPCTSSANGHHQRLPLAEIPVTDCKVRDGQCFTPEPKQTPAPEAATSNPPTHSTYQQNIHADYVYESRSEDARKVSSPPIGNHNQDTVPSFGLPATYAKERESPSYMAIQNIQATVSGNQGLCARYMQTETVGGKSKDMLTSNLIATPCHTPDSSNQHWQPTPAYSSPGAWYAESAVKVHHLGAPVPHADAPVNSGAPAHHVDPAVHRVDAPLDCTHVGAPVQHSGATVYHRGVSTKEQGESTLENWYTGVPLHYQPGHPGKASYNQYIHQAVAPNSQTVTHAAQYPLEPYFHYTD